MLKDQLGRALDLRKERGTLRGLKRFTLASEKDANQLSAQEDGALIDFSSNDYIGLARCKEMQQSVIQQMQAKLHDKSSSSSLGSTGSRLLDGNSKEHEELEHRLARHFGAPSSLLFNSGFDANTSLLAFLPQADDFILYDELAHASMHDGMRASRVKRSQRMAFKHNDLRDLEQKLDTIIRMYASEDDAKRPNVFIAVEAVYSMDGDCCPLRELVQLVKDKVPRERRCIIVDEAHSVGLYGLNGAGLCDAVGVCGDVDIRLVTFGKAFGCSGAAVLCEPVIRLYLINYARPLIYSTAIPFPSLFAIQAALDRLNTPSGALRAARTFELTQTFLEQIRAALANLPRYKAAPLALTTVELPFLSGGQEGARLPSPPIVPIVTSKARELAQYLIERGFLVRPICYPTVPKGSERVRICIHAHNDHESVLALARSIEEWMHREMQSNTQTSSLSREALEKAKL